MSKSPYETIQSGIAVLAEDEPTWSDGPFPVRGVALPEDIVTNGDNTEGVATYWPADVVQDAASLFEGVKIVDGSEHTAEEVLENPQPSPETIVGEITQAQYRPGVGVLYEGEVDDPELAKRIDRERVEVSPSLFRSLDGEHDDLDARVVEEVMAVRDLSIVAEGAAAGNSIEPASAAMTALSAEVLSEAFAETLKSVAGVMFDGTREGTLDESAIPNDDFESHYLFDGDTKSESSYPVVDADGFLRRGNVASAFQLGARGGVSESDLHRKLRALNDEFETPPIDPAKLEANASSQWRARIGSGDDLTGATASGRASAERTYTAEITENDD